MFRLKVLVKQALFLVCLGVNISIAASTDSEVVAIAPAETPRKEAPDQLQMLKEAFPGFFTPLKLGGCFKEWGQINWDKVQILLTNDDPVLVSKAQEILNGKISPCIQDVYAVNKNPNLANAVKQSCSASPETSFDLKQNICAQAYLGDVGKVFGSANFIFGVADKCSANKAVINFQNMQKIIAQGQENVIDQYIEGAILPCIKDVASIKENPHFIAQLQKSCDAALVQNISLPQKDYICKRAQAALSMSTAFGSPSSLKLGQCSKEWGAVNWDAVSTAKDQSVDAQKLITNHINAHIQPCLEDVSNILANPHFVNTLLQSCASGTMDSTEKTTVCKRAQAAQLVLQGFTKGLSTCAKEWGSIKWDVVQKIVQLGPEYAEWIGKFIRDKANACVKDIARSKENPNYLKTLVASCADPDLAKSQNTIKVDVCSYANAVNEASQAFGAPLKISKLDKCAKEWASIDWAKVKAILDKPDGQHKDLAMSHLQSVIAPCVKDIVSVKRNSNFVGQLKQSCDRAAGVSFEQKTSICSRIDMLQLNKAFPISGVMTHVPACSKVWADINWVEVKNAIDAGYEQTVRSHIGTKVIPCVQETVDAYRNPNFTKQLYDSCSKDTLAFPIKNYVCHLAKRGNTILNVGPVSFLTQYILDPFYGLILSSSFPSDAQFNQVLGVIYFLIDHWKGYAYQKLSVEIPDSKLDIDTPRMVSKAYDVIAYLSKNGALVGQSATTFLNKCKPMNPYGQVVPGKKAADYILLNTECSKQAFDIFVSQRETILSKYNVDPESSRNIVMGEYVAKGDINQPTDESALIGKCRRQYITEQRMSPSCVNLVGILKDAARQDPASLLMYNGEAIIKPINMQSALKKQLDVCSEVGQFVTPACQSFVAGFIKDWPLDINIKINPLDYFLKNTNNIEGYIKDSDLNQLIHFEKYRGFKDAGQLFDEVYSMACALNPVFRIPSITKESGIQDNLINSVNKKFNNLADNVEQQLGIYSKSKDKDAGFITATSLSRYIKNWDAISDEDKKAILSGSFDPEKVNIEIDYDALYGVLAKVCMQILGAGYLSTEKQSIQALAEGNVDIAKEAKALEIARIKEGDKGNDVLRLLPTSEYNKLRQVALIMLNNIHLIMIEDNLQKLGKIDDSSRTIQIIKSQLPKQMVFFSRLLLSIKNENYQAADMEQSVFIDGFIDLFISKIYPERGFDTQSYSTMIDKDSSNLFSVYSKYVIGSIYGVVDGKASSFKMDNRKGLNKVLADFIKLHGQETKDMIQKNLKLAIKGGLTALIPIPGVADIGTGIIMFALNEGAEQLKKKVENTCKLTRSACVDMNINRVDFTKPLEGRIAEFLESVGNGLNNQLKEQQKDKLGMGLGGESSENVSDTEAELLMPSLFIINNNNLSKQSKAADIAEVSELIQALSQRARDYYTQFDQFFSAVNKTDVPEQSSILSDPVEITPELGNIEETPTASVSAPVAEQVSAKTQTQVQEPVQVLQPTQLFDQPAQNVFSTVPVPPVNQVILPAPPSGPKPPKGPKPLGLQRQGGLKDLGNSVPMQPMAAG